MTCRNYLGTINNPGENGYEILEKIFKQTGAAYLVGQMEKGQSGTPHLQYFINFKQSVRTAQIIKVFKEQHLERVKINNGADNYCMKEEGRLDGPWTFGVRPIKRSDKTDWELVYKNAQEGKLDQIPKDILVRNYGNIQKIKKDHIKMACSTHETKGVWIYGQTGCGKSTKAIQDYPNAYRKLANKWWDGYQGEEYVILDDLDMNHKVLSYHLKLWADHHPCIGEIKGGAIALDHKKFVVTSQYTPHEIFEGKDLEAILRRF